MKYIISLIILFNSLTICNEQTKDSICLHYLTFNSWQKIRPIDSVGFSKYKIDSEYFRKILYNDTLYIRCNNGCFCLNGRVLIGEYTNQDSIHVIDFIEDTLAEFHIEGFCKVYVSKNQLFQIKRITFGPKKSYKFLKCVIYITSPHDTTYIPHDSAYTYTLTQQEIPDSVLNIIKTLKDDSVITFDDIEVMYENRKIMLPFLGYVIKD